ncbi:MAG: heavy metal-associated domain-containing protein [Clostridiaceae bacterium]|nr:heavy metal-associated domain-containing protein [Clostridiaceae bacterium]
MKSIIKVLNINKSKDIRNIQRAVSMNEGVIASEVSIEKKEVQVIYNDSIVDLDTIIDSIENMGYMTI